MNVYSKGKHSKNHLKIKITFKDSKFGQIHYFHITIICRESRELFLSFSHIVSASKVWVSFPVQSEAVETSVQRAGSDPFRDVYGDGSRAIE